MTKQASRFLARIILVLAGCIIAFPSAYADTVYLKNGRKMEGLIVEDKEESIVIEIGFGRVGIKRAEIDRIEKSDEAGEQTLRQQWEREKQERQIRAQEEKLKDERRPREASLGTESGALVVDVLLNKKVKASLILDTGASLVTINRNIVEQLGIDVDGIKQVDHYTLADGSKRQAKRTVLASVSVQGMEAQNVEVSIMENTTPSPTLRDGLLGMSFLKHFIFKIDQKNNKLILEKSP